ncbi:hypothetical protein [Brevibacillus daliensis]|uniref:hypothetical protein n=1 Tax=Brevibacillus daliensis TaxID=2892995 RepID=UPI001E3FD22E|nr:hypothetical protein [Brevibacillus daliensis]
MSGLIYINRLLELSRLQTDQYTVEPFGFLFEHLFKKLQQQVISVTVHKDEVHPCGFTLEKIEFYFVLSTCNNH